MSNAAELVTVYTEYCAMLRIAKPSSAVLKQLKTLHQRQVAAKAAHAAEEEQRAAARRRGDDIDDSGEPLTQYHPKPLQLPHLDSLDLSAAYLGGRGLIAIAGFCRHLLDLTELDISNAQWFSTDGRSNAVDGAMSLRLACQLLGGHGRLARLNFGTVEFGPSQYLWLVELLKATPSLTDLVIDAPNLEQHEILHLQALCKVNRKRMERVAVAAAAASAAATAAAAPATDASYFADGGDTVSAADGTSTLQQPADATTAGAPGDPLAATQTAADAAALALEESTTQSARSTALGSVLLAGLDRTSPTRHGSLASAERIIRGVGADVAAVLLGPEHPGHKIVPTGIPTEKTDDQRTEIMHAFDNNGLLRHVPENDRISMLPHLRHAVFPDDGVIIEQYDAVDYAMVLTRGGGVSLRSDDISMMHPPGSVIGEEELMPGTQSDARRFTVRARAALVAQPLRDLVIAREAKRHRRATLAYAEATSNKVLPGVSVADGGAAVTSVSVAAASSTSQPAVDVSARTEEPPATRVEAWLIPRGVFREYCTRPAQDQRQRWRRLVDLLPSLQGLGTMAKLAVADALDERKLAAGDIVTAGFAMLSDVMIIVDGSAMVYFQHTELKKFVRGELFVCHPATDVARCSVVACDGGVTVAYIAPRLFGTLPLHVQEHFATLARTFTLMDDGQASA